MRIFSATFAAVVGLLAMSCSEKSATNGEEKPNPKLLSEDGSEKNDSGSSEESESGKVPEPDEIGEDCVAFLRATTAVPPNHETKGCPTCPANGASVEVLKFNDAKIDRISAPIGSSCEVDVRIRAQFNPSVGGRIAGGLVGWISPEQREQYARGITPSGTQVYKVKVSYSHANGSWRAIEFAPTDSK